MVESNPEKYYSSAPTSARRAVLDAFIAEYCKDWNPLQAAIRIGFNSTYAKEFAVQFIAEPYVAQKVMEYKETPQDESVDDKLKIKQRIEQTLLRAMDCGDPKVEVAASAKLAEMRGLNVAANGDGDELQKLINSFKELAKDTPD